MKAISVTQVAQIFREALTTGERLDETRDSATSAPVKR